MVSKIMDSVEERMIIDKYYQYFSFVYRVLYFLLVS